MVYSQYIINFIIVIAFVAVIYWQRCQQKINKLQGEENNFIYERLVELEKKK